MRYYLKLRKNIILEGDIQLASREIMHLFKEVNTISREEGDKIPDFVPTTQKFSNIREGKIIGFVTSEPKVSVGKLILFLSFIQEIWCQDEVLKENAFSAIVSDTFCAIPVMAMSEYLSYVNKINELTIEECKEIFG